MRVAWELSVKPIDASHCEHSNSVTATATDGFRAFIEKHSVPLKQAAASRQVASGDHNRWETPLFAKRIERKAFARSAPARLRSA